MRLNPSPAAPSLSDLAAALARLPGMTVRPNAPLRKLARFGIGGPAALLAETAETGAFVAAAALAAASGAPWMVLGGGTNLIVADEGFPGLILRFRGSRISVRGSQISVESGAELQSLVDASIGHSLAGLHTLTRIPGWTGGALYGNAGAYGHSMQEFVRSVAYFDGRGVATVEGAGCEYRYRESIFKRRKSWIILSAELELPEGDPALLARRAREIEAIRDAKYPPTMRCAGSIFKNLILHELGDAVAAQVPAKAVIEGKVPAAWFLEQVGAKGMRQGAIQVAPYHANLIYNDGQGRAADFAVLANDLKRRVEDRFGLRLEEEVQYVGF